MPIFYFCNWDYDGLRIFQRVKNIIPDIALLIPISADFSKSVKSPNHKSDWIYTKNFSNLDYGLYSNDAKKIIEYLIRRKEWIEEENNDLIDMLTLYHKYKKTEAKDNLLPSPLTKFCQGQVL